MAEREASGDSDYLDEPDYPDDSGRFDAFNVRTWSFAPPATPWYRTKSAVTAIIAASAAMAAIVVSTVLLVVRGPDSTGDGESPSVTPTAPTSAEPDEVATSVAPPPPPPPPPSPPETASPVLQYRPTSAPRPTKSPAINVTRTPITRSGISFAPQPHPTHPGPH